MAGANEHAAAALHADKTRSGANIIAEDYYIAQCRGQKPNREEALKAFAAWQTPGDTWNTDFHRIFTPDVAKVYGYRVTPTVRSDLPNPNQAPTSPDAKWQKCFEQLRKVHPPPPYDGRVQEIQISAYSLASKDQAVQESVKRWRICLTKAIDYAVPASPAEMPTKEIASAFKIPEGLEGMPTGSEIEVALKDAHCQVESGYLETLHAAEASQQERMMIAERSRVNDEITQFGAYDQVMEGVLSGAAP